MAVEESKIKIPLTLGAVSFMAVVVWQLAAVYNKIESAERAIIILEDSNSVEMEVLEQRMEKRYTRIINEIEYLKVEIHDQRDVMVKMDKDIAVMNALNKWE